MKPERFCPAADGSRDVAERDKSYSHACQTGVLIQHGACFNPATRSYHLILRDESTPAGKQQGHGVISDLFDEHIRRIGDPYVVLGGGGNIDIVESNGR